MKTEKIKLKYIANFTGETVQPFEGEKEYYSTGAVDGDEEVEMVTFDNKPSRANIQVKENDILIAKMKDTEKTTLVTKEMENNIYSTGFAVLNANSKLDTRYLYYLLSNNEFSCLKNINSYGTTQQAINEFNLKNLFVTYVVDRTKQEKIVQKLDEIVPKIDNLISEHEKDIEDLEEYKKAVITEAVTKGLDKTVELKDSNVNWIGLTPKTWQVLKTLYVLKMPITDGPHTTPDLFDSGIPFVSAEAVSCGNGGIDFNHIRGYISEEFYEECCKKYIPEKYDIYMIKSGATTGRVSIVTTEEKFTIWSPLAVFRCNNKKILPYYLFYFIQSNSFQKQVENNWSFGTQQNIGMRTIEQLKICLPSLKEQQEIIDFLNKKCVKINALIKEKEALIEDLKSYKKSVIFEYVTGKKEI